MGTRRTLSRTQRSTPHTATYTRFLTNQVTQGRKKTPGLYGEVVLSHTPLLRVCMPINLPELVGQCELPLLGVAKWGKHLYWDWDGGIAVAPAGSGSPSVVKRVAS